MKQYNLILADPPWQQTKGGLRKSRPNQTISLDYPTLTSARIGQILLSVCGYHEPNVLFLWTIDSFLYEAELVAKSLGYKLHARIIWDKENGIAPAFTIRYSHEYLLWLYRSPFLPIAKEYRGKFTTVLREKAKRHSQKPLCAYEMIEKLYPNTTKIELFARKKREGWTSIGNEIDGVDIKESLDKLITQGGNNA